jgi:hypothetical protein
MDIYDGADWTEMDIEDLRSEIEAGRSIKDAAEFLCRADSVTRLRGNAVSWASLRGKGCPAGQPRQPGAVAPKGDLIQSRRW